MKEIKRNNPYFWVGRSKVFLVKEFVRGFLYVAIPVAVIVYVGVKFFPVF